MDVCSSSQCRAMGITEMIRFVQKMSEYFGVNLMNYYKLRIGNLER